MMKRLNRTIKYLIIVSLLIFLNNALPLSANKVTLSWNPPLTNEDGSVLTDLEGYVLYYGTESGIYSNTIEIPKINTFSFYDLKAGLTYYFAVTAFNYNGFESDYSNEISLNLGELQPPEIISPLPGSKLGGSTATFHWTNNNTNVDNWLLYVASNQSGFIYDGTDLSATASGLPLDGSEVYVLLMYQSDGLWYSKEYFYTAGL